MKTNVTTSTGHELLAALAKPQQGSGGNGVTGQRPLRLPFSVA